MSPAKRQKTAADTAEKACCTIDPDGDLELVLDDRCLIVSSSALKLSSTVFAAMLNSRFREGQRPQDGKRRSISLEEDDSSAMQLFCEVVHFKVPSNKDLESSHLLALAIVVDKYDCARQLSLPVSALFVKMRYEEGKESFHSMANLAAAAVLSYQTAHFFALTKSMIINYKEPFSSVLDWPCHEYFPTHALLKASEARQTLQDIISQALKDATNIYCEADCDYKVDCGLLSRLAKWLDPETGCWPPDFRNKYSIGDFLKRLEILAVEHAESPGCPKHEPESIWEWKLNTVTLAKDFHAEAHGLCLECTISSSPGSACQHVVRHSNFPVLGTAWTWLDKPVA